MLVTRKAPVSWIPRPYMKRGVRFLLENGAGALWLDPGLGKTAITLRAFSYLLKEGIHRRMLVVAPLRVAVSVWPKEGRKWKEFNHLRIVTLHGPKKEELLREDADIYCINPEGLPWLLSDNRLKILGADVICFDESTKFKNTDTARFKMIKPVLPKFKRRWALTGTPATNGMMDVFGQVYLLDLGHSLGAYKTHFRYKYFDPSPDGFGWVLRPGCKEQIYKKIEKLVLRLAAEDWIELPEVVENEILVRLDPDSYGIYREMEKKLYTILKDGTKISAVNSGVAGGKCLQIANGGVYSVEEPTEPGKKAVRKTKHIHNAKIEALLDLLEEISGQPSLILYPFEQDYRRLKEALPPSAVFINEHSARVADGIFDKWNRGEIQYMVAQPSSIGHGLNIQEGGQHMIWFGLPWDLEIYIQCVDRFKRQGSAFSKIICHHLLADNTIDLVVRDTLRAKDHDQSSLLNAMREYTNQRYGSVEKIRVGR